MFSPKRCNEAARCAAERDQCSSASRPTRTIGARQTIERVERAPRRARARPRSPGRATCIARAVRARMRVTACMTLDVEPHLTRVRGGPAEDPTRARASGVRARARALLRTPPTVRTLAASGGEWNGRRKPRPPRAGVQGWLPSACHSPMVACLASDTRPPAPEAPLQPSGIHPVFGFHDAGRRFEPSPTQQRTRSIRTGAQVSRDVCAPAFGAVSV